MTFQPTRKRVKTPLYTKAQTWMSFSGWFTTYPSQLSVMALFISAHIKKTIIFDGHQG